MIYLVIGLFVAMAVGAFLRQQSKRSEQTPETEQTPSPELNPESLDIPDVEIADEEDTGDSGFVLSAKPVTDPDRAAGATYSSHAPAGEDSPYGLSSEPKKQAQAKANLLRWCGRSGNVQLDNIVVPGPVAYWSNGEPATPEPSCIDITLPVAFPQKDEPLPAEGAESYAAMTPLQRGIYLTWLAGARIQPPIHMCYPAIWLYGIERRTITDKLDLGMCINEAFRLMPLLIRWDALRDNLVRFITWLAIKVWLPDEDLLALCKKLNTVPEGLLDILLNSYANSMLPLPSAVAFTVIRTSAKLRREGQPEISHSDEALQKFTPIYKELCKGGLIFIKPQTMLKVSYKPANPSVSLSKKDNESVEIPDFFADLSVFKPLLDSWEVFLEANKAEKPSPDLSNISERPDFEGFVNTLRPEGSDLPLIATLGSLGKLMKFNVTPNGKLTGKERKAIVDTAQVEGWQVLPDLGISGREYKWDDRMLLTELAPGTQLSQSYRVASFLLEFTCASIAADEDRVFEPLRRRMNEYFKLTDDDNLRLEAQKPLNLPTQYGPEYYGEFLCGWLSENERKSIKGLILHAVSFMPEFGGNPEVNSILCEVMKLREDEAPSPEDAGKTANDWGNEVLNLMTLLFKNN
ncbi:MAG: TerB N-terminal domain-containing protein [Synergistaceae bacterium]|nr:TerB N-terminal domain-containing protein [Synergistaceae bacterium]